jgi:hypothetical protein
MIVRIATFNAEPDVDPAKHEEFRQWMGGQPGIVSGYHVRDPKSGKVVSITFWTDMPSLLAIKDRVFPGGPLGIKPDAVDIFEVAHVFGPSACPLV